MSADVIPQLEDVVAEVIKQIPPGGSAGTSKLYISIIFIFIFIFVAVILLIVLLVTRSKSIDETKLTQTLKNALSKEQTCDKQESKWLDMIKKSVSADNICQSEEARWTKIVNDAATKSCDITPITPITQITPTTPTTPTTSTAPTASTTSKYIGDRIHFNSGSIPPPKQNYGSDYQSFTGEPWAKRLLEANDMNSKLTQRVNENSAMS